MKFFIQIFCFLIVVNSYAETSLPSSGDQTNSTNPFNETKIPIEKVVLEIPTTSMDTLKTSFSKKSIPWWAGIVGSTLILLNNDEVILENWQREGRAAGLGNEDKTKAVLSAGEIDLLRLPTDTGSWMYFLGDGWMHFGISAGFLINGHTNDNVRAYNTGLRLIHGMTTSTIFSQLLKRAFGRESPYVRTEPFGKWSPFPSIPEYQKRTAFYDAMPSGHVMTATLTFTIINEAYPEYSNYTIPLASVWVAALSYQMVNNGVHWASDYPLGIAMGYVFGKASAQMGKPKSETDTSTTTWMILPTSTPESQGLTWLYQY
jgi:membrane-associated phospholipid phosphatase